MEQVASEVVVYEMVLVGKAKWFLALDRALNRQARKE
jgi:hypothetical protein